MLQESLDLRAEADELRAFLETLGEEDWGRPTGFMHWTPWDVVAHLHFFDRVSMLALKSRDAFAAKRDAFVAEIVGGLSTAEIARREYGDMSPTELLARWHATCHEMAEQLGRSDPKRRLPWFGPDMGVRMFTTARFMETWAHGQEVYDLMRVRRTYTDRIQSIAVIGMKTFGWTFVNRGLEAPGAPPYVRLVAPSGAIWEWNEPSESERIRGDAVDFCHVVTQGRNIADTTLEVVGDVARRWMSIAQCFAGGPVDPPKPGERSGG
ncbi:MAG: TIGR03084 family metal-binding protein [Myxococcales bacterium]|nr:TIGR03084 family metal-binding protein [Myxococcales bacterium]